MATIWYISGLTQHFRLRSILQSAALPNLIQSHSFFKFCLKKRYAWCVSQLRGIHPEFIYDIVNNFELKHGWTRLFLNYELWSWGVALYWSKDHLLVPLPKICQTYKYFPFKLLFFPAGTVRGSEWVHESLKTSRFKIFWGFANQ